MDFAGLPAEADPAAGAGLPRMFYELIRPRTKNFMK
jgi:hypothetical protein